MSIPYSLLSPAALEDLKWMARSSPPGCFVELGVYQGGTAFQLAMIAGFQNRDLILFDTFKGIPEESEHDNYHKTGDFNDTSLEAVKAAIPGAIFYVGVFPATMPDPWPHGRIAFAHIDCDQYESTKAAIDCFWPLMARGGVMLFDDYGVSTTKGATKAVDDASDRMIRRDTVMARTQQGKAYFTKVVL
jgi:O-methyltransferase